MKILIVGGGLSGFCIAHHLEKEGIDFKIIDKGENFSSRIAAGMINPMVFRKMVKTWRGDQLIPYLKAFYSEIETKIGKKFFFPRAIRRVFSTPEEAELWKDRLEDKSFDEYIFPSKETPVSDVHIIEKYGSGWVKAPGYIDSAIFMDAHLAYFSQKNKLKITSFDFNKLDLSNLNYDGEKFDRIVFAEGYMGKENPYFSYLPLKQTKGEVLTIKSNEFRKDEILNRKCFVLPLESGNYKLGATFTWNTTSTEATEEAKTTLLEQFKGLSNAKIEIIDQEAGIRPTVADRRPLIGEHPIHKNLFIFNGMGTKGYMLAPFWARHFVKHLMEETPLDSEVNIQRFYKKHFLNKGN